MFIKEQDRLVFRYDAEQLWVEPWGRNALRVRATQQNEMPLKDWALQDKPPNEFEPKILIKETAIITNGKITATITKSGKLTISNERGKVLLEEFSRNRRDETDPKCSALEIEAREFKGLLGGDYHVTCRFESDPDEKIFGMGQYQQPNLNLKGHDLELAQRNSQSSVPFALSSLGYGFLWNNPAIGRAVFGMNVATFEAYSSTILDYWVVCGDSPQEIVETYADVTGKVPMMPEYGLGFWQCKLRYQTQDELLSVAREYSKRNVQLDVIVVDFFHWPKQGEWKFDPTYWPDPDAMIQELKGMGVELMVSIWPTVDYNSENYNEMRERGLLTRTDKGIRIAMNFQGDTIYTDVTNPEAREYIWGKVKINYHSKGIKTFWLDEAEPEYTVYSFDNYRYHAGSNLQIGNIYPVEFARAFYEGQTAAGQTDIVNLIRCAWAGSQKFGALVWSGDIASSWPSFRSQLAAGLNMGIAGIPWWTTDIGGFHGGDPRDPAFRELFVRWFQWGAYCPVMRLHGNRLPQQPQYGDSGGAQCQSGAPNEIWSYGDEVYEICKKYIELRGSMRDYLRELMNEAHVKGSPVMRPCFYEFPEDENCWEKKSYSIYMLGHNYLCCPVLEPGQRKMTVYLPKLKDGKWFLNVNQEEYEGGQSVEIPCPLESMPVFQRVGLN
ncbi:Alpha-glucosidase [Arthrobotrys entomopaga]|nr:Alpha-glucosidase [Arthrobotrys entomopaga]